ncbi:MAG: VUT family protein, partial [Bacteroidales bacterium]|nr:VUT family protein [Bacteroidales bacterium]
MQKIQTSGQRQGLSVSFMMLAIIFNVCLIASNLFETKLFTAAGVALTGGVLIFPVSYIINDCLVEVYGYRKARLIIWTGFAMNFFVVAAAQIVR